MAPLLGAELGVPQARDLDVLGSLGAHVVVGGLDGLEHTGNLASDSVHLPGVGAVGRG